MVLIPLPLVGGALSLDGIRGRAVCLGRGALGSLFTDGWGCDSHLDYYLAWGFSELIDKARFSPNGHFQRKALLLNIPESFAFNILPSQQATFTPAFPGCPPRTVIRFDPDSCGDFALPWDPVHV